MLMFKFFALLQVLVLADALNILIPGGTGPLGQAVASRLGEHDLTILTRNAFLASAPNRASSQFGWVGRKFLKQNPHVKLRDWDGGDLLDIVGQDWIGWQDDALAQADVVVHMVGSYTEQRVMACERIVKESLRVNPQALHITVAPIEQDLEATSPSLITVKKERLNKCEDLVKGNVLNSVCLRIECYRIPQGCDAILNVIDGYSENS